MRGYVATRSATGTKTDSPIIETPQSISVVPRDQLDAQQLYSAKEALRYSAGTVPESRGNFGGYDIIYNRGFVVDRYLDGMRLQGNTGFVTPQVELYGMERVELLRGPASVLFGQGSPGGLLNMVSRRPPSMPGGEILLQAGNYGRLQGAFDVGGPIDKDGQFLYRVTGLGRFSDNQVDFVREERAFIAPAFTWRPDADTTFTILGSYQNDPRVGLYNFVPAVGSVLPNPNGKIPTSFYAGDPNFNRIDREQASIGYQFEHRVDDVWTVRQNLRYLYTSGHLDQVLPFGLEADNRTLDRYVQANRETIGTFSMDNQLQANFSTGPLQHKLLMGLDYQRTEFTQNQVLDFTAPPIDIFSPTYRVPIGTPTLFPSKTDQTTDQLGLYAQDQIKLGKLIVVAGGRYDRAQSDTATLSALDGDSHVIQRDSATTGRIGGVYLFDNGVAPYAVAATSFNPTAGIDSAGQPFRPTTGTLYEAGVRYQPPGWNALVTASVYDLTQQNVLTADTSPGNLGQLSQTGEVRSQGFEIEGRFSLTDRLDVIASYTYIDARVTKSADVAAGDLGKIPLWIPHNTASVWADYTIRDGQLSGLGFAFGVRYVGDSFGDPANTLRIPDYTLVDAAIHYDLAAWGPQYKGYRFALNVSNLFDKTYVSECTGDNCLYGLRRKVLASLRYRW